MASAGAVRGRGDRRRPAARRRRAPPRRRRGRGRLRTAGRRPRPPGRCRGRCRRVPRRGARAPTWRTRSWSVGARRIRGGRWERGHEIRRRGLPGAQRRRQRRWAGRRAQDASEREMERRADAEPAEDHDREPHEEEERDRAPDPAHPAQPPPARVFEHAARGIALRDVRGHLPSSRRELGRRPRKRSRSTCSDLGAEDGLPPGRSDV